MPDYAHPPKVKVGHAVYTLEAADDGMMGMIGAHGLCNSDTRRILIAESKHPNEYGYTMLHELMHAGARIFSLGMDHETEERVVDVMSNALSTMIADNPELFAWLVAAHCYTEDDELAEADVDIDLDAFDDDEILEAADEIRRNNTDGDCEADVTLDDLEEWKHLIATGQINDLLCRIDSRIGGTYKMKGD